jgi:hypothetical protein
VANVNPAEAAVAAAPQLRDADPAASEAGLERLQVVARRCAAGRAPTGGPAGLRRAAAAPLGAGCGGEACAGGTQRGVERMRPVVVAVERRGHLGHESWLGLRRLGLRTPGHAGVAPSNW